MKSLICFNAIYQIVEKFREMTTFGQIFDFCCASNLYTDENGDFTENFNSCGLCLRAASITT